MKRRAFIAGLGSAAAWPLAASGQQTKIWRVGYLSSAFRARALTFDVYDAFAMKLHELGYVEGKNLTLYVRSADGDYARLSALAEELVALSPDVIVGIASPATAALQRATTSIPIVMGGIANPIASGFVKSLANPGGNITGTSTLGADISAKSFELLHTISPNVKRVAVLVSPNPQLQMMFNEARAASEALGLSALPVTAESPADFEVAFATMDKEKCEALIVLTDPRITQKIVELVNQRRLPAIYQTSGFVDLGGLLSYSANFNELARQTAIYVDRILKGANLANLPVEQPTRFELQVNLKTAKSLGLTIPDSIIARADKVIE